MRLSTFLSALFLGPLAVSGQQTYGSSSTPSTFEYHGCAVVNLQRFGDPIFFTDGKLTHDQCQAACQGQQIAALFPDSCRCGNGSDAYASLDASACDYPCMGDPTMGMCGSRCPDKDPGVSTIYITTEVVYREGDDPSQDPAPSDPASIPQSSIASSVSAASSGNSQPSVSQEQSSSILSGPGADPSTEISGSSAPSTASGGTTPTPTPSDPSSRIVPSTLSGTDSSIMTRPTPSHFEGSNAEPPVPPQIPATGTGFRTACGSLSLGGIFFMMLLIV